MEQTLASGDEWKRTDPEDVGVDSDALRSAVEYALCTGTPPKDVAYDFSNTHPWTEEEAELGYGALGPMPDRRGGPAGIVLKDGRPIAEWGDVTRVDHTFSVAKTFLGIVAGIAWDRDLIDSVDDPVADYVDDGGFESPQNADITWRQLLQGTSEWEGTLFDRPDSVDRNRPVGRDPDAVGEAGQRELREPGTYWEYNDVRINRLALALLRLWKKPLDRVLAHEVMEPIGASGRWEWHGYYNSSVLVDGERMVSVSGGGHWGGGLWISARDLARVGQLLLDGGTWGDRQLLSQEWIDMMTEPCPINDDYGFLVWLNEGNQWPSAPQSSYAAFGFGRNIVWIDPEDDTVAVLRWLAPDEGDDWSNLDRFFESLLSAIDDR